MWMARNFEFIPPQVVDENKDYVGPRLLSERLRQTHRGEEQQGYERGYYELLHACGALRACLEVLVPRLTDSVTENQLATEPA